MPTPTGASVRASLSVNSAATGIGVWPVTKAGTVKSVWVGPVGAVPTNASVTVKKGTAVLTSSATVDLSGGTANTVVSQSLTTATGSLRVAAGDVLVCASTITTTNSMTAVACVVVIEPDEW
jgi:hypothetical protein